MGAREKLNSAHVCGSLLTAALMGFVAQSWVVFFIAAAILLALAVNAGDIRPPKHR